MLRLVTSMILYSFVGNSPFFWASWMASMLVGPCSGVHWQALRSRMLARVDAIVKSFFIVNYGVVAGAAVGSSIWGYALLSGK